MKQIMLKTEMKEMPKNCYKCKVYADCPVMADFEELPADCLFIQFPSREQAREIIRSNVCDIEAMLDKLGFGKEAK